ncbi:MAG: ribose-5-phosphate isomerase RpiA [Caldilineaceae bacterium SB0668_bin_21]|nr:ribose-5-phosphate isomerase RpiA [Caldilineaceae bacterium SB0668_bin_21]MYC21983.1 ribose-5-phosphate isomerase RpiA [Caldilineaceae bacterium SB0662_bin_25]
MQIQEVDALKRQAAEAAVAHIESGMVVGLGAGSTALKALECIAERLAVGRLTEILGVPSSEQVAEDARRLAIPLTTLDCHPRIDLTIDGADEVDPQLRVIKGGGGALLREKIVAQASEREMIIVDERKLSARLGEKWALPVEVLAFGLRAHVEYIERLGAAVQVRTVPDGSQFRTDSGNLILDCQFGPMEDPECIAGALERRAGIVEHGLFLDLVTDLVVASPAGTQHLTR